MPKNALYLIFILQFFLCSSWNWIAAQEMDRSTKISCELYRNFEPTKKTCINMDSTIFTYNKQGYKMSAITYSGEKKVQAIIQTNYTYNIRNLITHESYVKWDMEKNKWSNTPFKQAKYVYNEADSLTTILYESYAVNTWNKVAKWEFTYNENKQKTEEVEFSWDAEKNSWSNVGCQKTNFQYANNRSIKKINYQWNYELSQFNMVSKNEYTYTLKGKLETSTNLVWTAKKNWEPNSKDSLIYDSNNLLITQIGFTANNTKPNYWEKVYKNSLIYDKEFRLIQNIQTFWNEQNQTFSIDLNAHELSYNYSNDGLLNAVFEKQFDISSKQFVTFSETLFIVQPIKIIPKNNKQRS